MTPTEKPLTIAHVDAESGFSGGEVQVFLLIEGLRRRGHRNVLMCPPASRCESEARARGIDARAVRMSNDLDLASVVALKRAFAQALPDLVHLHSGRATWLGGLAARLAGLPAITTRRMDREVKRSWRTRLVYASLVRRAVAISPAVRECLLAGGVDASRTLVIQSSVDPRAIEPRAGRDATRAALGARDEDVVVLALASLVRRKGIDVLLDALANLGARSMRPLVWIAGRGPERAALETQAESLGLASRVRFLGERADAADLLAACDVFVLPARREGLGVSALEAMAVGRAVVASRVGGLAQAVVEGRTGLLVAPGEPRALSQALARVIEDPVLRARLAAAGPARVREGYLAEQMVDAYEALYREVLAESALA